MPVLYENLYKGCQSACCVVDRLDNLRSQPDIRIVSSKFLYSCSDNLQQETRSSRKSGSRRNLFAETILKGTCVPWTSKIRNLFKGLMCKSFSKKESLKKLEKLPSRLRHSRFEAPKIKQNYQDNPYR